MLITLPDKSVARLYPRTLSFEAMDSPAATPPAEVPASDVPHGINCELLADCLSNPTNRFSECLRRMSDTPRYSPKGINSGKAWVNLLYLTRVYKFGGSYRGGLFQTSFTRWRFLDGGIVSQNGYGFGSSSHSFIAVEGIEATRAICLFFGIRQPRTIKGEILRRPLSILLQEMTSVPLQEPRAGAFNLPSPLERWP